MGKFLTGAVALAFVLPIATAYADTHESIDSLYDQGQREMAPHWHALGKTANAAVFIHAGIDNADNGRVAVWVDRELAWPDYFEKEHRYLSRRDRFVVDCKVHRTGVSDTAYYAEHYAGGALAGTERNQDVDMMNVVPDSIEEQITGIACARKPASPVKRAPHKSAKSTKSAKPATPAKAGKQPAPKAQKATELK